MNIHAGSLLHESRREMCERVFTNQTAGIWESRQDVIHTPHPQTLLCEITSQQQREIHALSVKLDRLKWTAVCVWERERGFIVCKLNAGPVHIFTFKIKAWSE